ncbi:DUF3885 domain-containing protein [Bacillus sp. DX4.1]|nr:DUF3885 domain-containing protein [Bacillus sp. DX4.1]MDM5188789.1 DUF3885 domain-containing protein [Bacillus sp. DX4.1]
MDLYIRPFYEKYKRWIPDYDRQKIDSYFTSI